MKIGIDIDNVISNFNDTIVEAYLQHDKQLRNTGIINDKAKVFRRGMFDWSEEEEKDFYYSNIEKWANDFKPIKDAEYYIKKLKQDGNEIYIISGRENGEYRNPYKLTEEWLEKTKFGINIINCIKYDSVDLFAEISMFIIYLFGFKNSFDFGKKYILAISFGTLITDTQWDISDAIKTVAQIDIAKKEFSYKEHMKNSRKLVWLLIISSIIMWIILYPFYKVDIIATLIIVGIELICMYLYPFYITKLTFVQMEYSAMKATISKQIANTLRIFCSFIAFPFCTSIGLAVSAIYQLVSMQYIISKNKLNMEMKL